MFCWVHSDGVKLSLAAFEALVGFEAFEAFVELDAFEASGEFDVFAGGADVPLVPLVELALGVVDDPVEGDDEDEDDEELAIGRYLPGKVATARIATRVPPTVSR
jgi:hypothetical protein